MLKRLFLTAAVLAAILVPAQADAAHGATIHPGDAMESSVGLCTLGFVAVGGGQTYFMTAAHCVDKVGEDIRLEDGPVFGDVAVIGDADATATDWALIDVRAAYDADVRLAVRGHPSFPSGVATPSETALGDVIRYSGHGVPWYVSATTREERVGLLGYHDAQIWDSNGPDTWGDSGGPVMHDASRQAIGLVSRLCIGPCTSEGPTVQGILSKAASKGFAVSLGTV